MSWDIKFLRACFGGTSFQVLMSLVVPGRPNCCSPFGGPVILVVRRCSVNDDDDDDVFFLFHRKCLLLFSWTAILRILLLVGLLVTIRRC